MYPSLKAAAEARNSAMYVSDSYMASAATADNNAIGSTSNKNQIGGGGSSNEGSFNNINHITTTSATNINNNNNGSSSGIVTNHDVIAISSAMNRNSDEFHHYQQPSHLSQLQQQQPPPPPLHLRYNQHYGSPSNNDSPPSLRTHIKQNSPALLSIEHVSHQPYSVSNLICLFINLFDLT